MCAEHVRQLEGESPSGQPESNYRQRIPLGETDAVTPSPIGNYTSIVRCDKCGKEYSYRASDVLKFEMEPPESLTPHPLFAEGGTDSAAAVERRTSQD